jgi:ABC-type nitrate/sulfonate/bicarbonate transport system substrate-binding protein
VTDAGVRGAALSRADAGGALESLWYTHSPDPTSLWLAVSTGRLSAALKPLGIRLQALLESSDDKVRGSYFDHHLSNSVRHGSNFPAVWARSEGRATCLIGTSWVDEPQLLVTTVDSGINSVRDLRGRRFGLAKGADIQVDISRARALRGLENALLLEGLEVADLELVDYPYNGTFISDDPYYYGSAAAIHLRSSGRRRCNRELTGLLRGDIDAIYMKGAHALHLADEFGLRIVIDVGAHPDPVIRSNVGTPRVLTVDRHLSDRYPEVVDLVLRTVLGTERWARDHPGETRRLLAMLMNSSEYWVAAAYGEDVHRRFRTGLDESSIAALQDMVRFLERWGFIAGAVDVREWAHPGPMERLLRAV